jgi:hypothetical protein
MTSLHLIFAILALVCFILAALNVGAPRLSLTPLGLAFLTLAMTDIL